MIFRSAPARLLLALLLAARAGAAPADDAFAAKQAGDYPRAIALYQELVAAEPANPAHLYQLGTVQGWAGHYDEALATLRRGLAIAPRDTDLRLSYGRVLAWSGHTSWAETVAVITPYWVCIAALLIPYTVGMVAKKPTASSMSIARMSPMRSSGVTVMGSWMRPWMWRFTRATSFTCSRGGML